MVTPISSSWHKNKNQDKAEIELWLIPIIDLNKCLSENPVIFVFFNWTP